MSNNNNEEHAGCAYAFLAVVVGIILWWNWPHIQQAYAETRAKEQQLTELNRKLDSANEKLDSAQQRLGDIEYLLRQIRP